MRIVKGNLSEIKMKFDDWLAGYKSGINGEPFKGPPSLLDGHSWVAGYIEGKANKWRVSDKNSQG